MKFLNTILAVCIAGLLLSCAETDRAGQSEAQQPTGNSEFSVPFKKITLNNGLQVIFHIDRSDPVVSVVLTSHVGSARELPGRTGFCAFV